jgi:hypothetical protein
VALLTVHQREALVQANPHLNVHKRPISITILSSGSSKWAARWSYILTRVQSFVAQYLCI